MFPGDSSSITIFPFKKSKEYSMKIKQYLNPLSNERLKVVDNVVCYKTDGGFRSKIGLTKENALPVFGNYSAAKNVLTIITYSLNSNEEYLSCNESEESEMFGGDVINSYNNSKSKEAFTFYELESAAPGLLLNKGEKNIHIHNTYHFEGSFNSLDAISLKLLGISLQKVKF